MEFMAPTITSAELLKEAVADPDHTDHIASAMELYIMGLQVLYLRSDAQT